MTEMIKAIVEIHSGYTSYVSNRRRSHGARRTSPVCIEPTDMTTQGNLPMNTPPNSRRDHARCESSMRHAYVSSAGVEASQFPRGRAF